MQKIIALFFVFATSTTAHARSCNSILSNLRIKYLNTNEVKEITTPFEDSSDRVKIILKAVRESWLAYGRPDFLSARTLGHVFMDHQIEIQKSMLNLESIKDKFLSYEDYKNSYNYLDDILSEFKFFQNSKYIDPKRFRDWGMKIAAINTYIESIELGFGGRFNKSMDVLSNDPAYHPNEAVTLIPIFAHNLSWREMNDLWILNIAPIGLTKEDHFVDGASGESNPILYAIHDMVHAADYAQIFSLSATRRLREIRLNFEEYKKFRRFQNQETNPRTKQLREGLMFFILHERANLFYIKKFNTLSPEAKDQSYLTNLLGKFLKDHDFNEGFNPKITSLEIITQIKYLIEKFP